MWQRRNFLSFNFLNSFNFNKNPTPVIEILSLSLQSWRRIKGSKQIIVKAKLSLTSIIDSFTYFGCFRADTTKNHAYIIQCRLSGEVSRSMIFRLFVPEAFLFPTGFPQFLLFLELSVDEGPLPLFFITSGCRELSAI